MAEELKILIVTDKFKGSLSAIEAAESIRKGLLNGSLACGQRVEIEVLPMADGGDGTIDVIMNSSGGELKYINVRDPLFRIISAPFLVAGRKVFIEMAKCSGLQLLKPSEYNPHKASSYGLGQMILAAAELLQVASDGDAASEGEGVAGFKVPEENVREIVIGIGGSATNDGGMGMLRALGYRFTDRKGEETAFPGEVTRIDDKTVSPFFKRDAPFSDRLAIKVACDVNNPLLGERGATKVYGPQKGADEKMVEKLECGLQNFAGVCEKFLGKSYAECPGAGAAGGVGFALIAFLGTELVPGWKVLSEMTDLESQVKKADLVITGEGSIDEQSISGKLIDGIASVAKNNNKPLWAYCGVNLLNEEQLIYTGIEKVFAISDIEGNKEESMKRAKKYLEKISFESATFLISFKSNRQTD